MASITSRTRDALPASKFALPSTRQYPIDSLKRAQNAKGRAKQALDSGHLSPAQYKQVVSRANAAIKSFEKR